MCRLPVQLNCYRKCQVAETVCDFRVECQENSETIRCSDYDNLYKKLCVLRYSSLDVPLTRNYFPFLELVDCPKYNKTCDVGQFLCPFYKYCIPIQLVCDGINHCFFNEDEVNCGKITNMRNENKTNKIEISFYYKMIFSFFFFS